MAGIVTNSAPYPIASLYVGDLDPDISEAQLYERFSQTGPVASIRICRDQITRQSLGYAYVNFQQPADAERALDTMNFDTIGGKPMRIMWSQRDPALRKSGFGNVFIKNLDKSIDNKALYDTFSTFGNILSCKIMVDENGESKGFGFVHFELQEAADQAIAKVNGMMLSDKKVYVGKFISNEMRKEQNGEFGNKYTNVFVKNFQDKLNDETLNDLFKQFGEITSGIIKKDENGISKGYGFVNFKNHESAVEAVNKMNGYELDDRKLFVGPFQKKIVRRQVLARKHEERKREKAAKYQGINLYVKNLDDKIDDEELRKYFSTFGNITSAKVMVDSQKRSKGFGFVCFSTPEEATRAVSDMKGKIVGSKPLYVALAQRKEDRRNQLVSQYKQRNSAARIQNHTLQYNTQYYIPPVYSNASPMYQQQVYQESAATPRYPKHLQSPTAHQMYSQIQLYSPNQPQRRFPFNNHVPIQSQMNHHYMQIRQRMHSNSSAYTNQQNRMFNQRRAPTRVDQNAQIGAQIQQSINVPGQEPLTSNMLAQAPPAEQKQMLGERLYPLIQNMYPELVGKITGMLLEIDNAELLHMLDTPESLREKVEEAVNVLRIHQTKPQ